MRMLLMLSLLVLGSMLCILAPGPLSAQDLEQMQKAADDWEQTCRVDLHIETSTLPWIIFYDSTKAWHINPIAELLPAQRKLDHTIHFAGKHYPLFELDHNGMIWVPERDAINAKGYLITTMPYGDNTNTFFIAPSRSYFHTLAPPPEHPALDQMLAGIVSHELAHTRQLPQVIPQLLAAQKKYKLPESLHDNTLEETFNKNEEYVRLFSQEKAHLWNAVVATNIDSCKKELRAALDIASRRKKTYFVGKHEGFNHIEDIFLALEGSAMWVQYKVSSRSLLPGQTPPQLLFYIVQHGDSWVQEEGLALFLIIDKLVPGWQQSFFSKDLPSPFDMLKKVSK